MAIYKRTPKTNAQARLEYLKSMQEQTIPLYENKPVEQEVSISDRIFEINKARNQAFKEQYEYLDEAQNVLLTNALFYSVLNPVLEEFGASTHEKNIGAEIITNFIQEQNIPELLENWKHKSIYLAELAHAVDCHTEKYKNRINKLSPENKNQEDYQIEDEEINDLIFDTKDIIPKDITKLISDRVEDSVDQFIDTAKKNKFEIKKIYDKAKEKVENAKASDDMNMTSDDIQQIQNEAVSFAKKKEREILEQNTNVFGYMINSIMKSIHEDKVLKESYSNEYNNLKFNDIVNDTRVIYSMLEAFNTLNIITVNENYLYNTLKEMTNKK